MATHLTKQKWAVSDALQEIVGVSEISRPQMTKKVWDYIKKNDLQNPKKKREILPDDLLSAVIGSNPIDMLKMTAKLSKHLTKID